MIILRDPAPWLDVASHPDVAPHVYTSPFDLAAVVARKDVYPLWFGRGGFLFHYADGALDLHAIFHPDAWGRRTSAALKAALAFAFLVGDVVTVSEVQGWWRSRPPRSFGFRPVADFYPCAGLTLRHWSLTRAQWVASPAFLRMSRCLQP